MSRRGVLIALVAVALGAAVVGWFAWPRDETSRATVGDALRSFRAEGVRPASHPGQPAFGVYRYMTSGGEEADSILNASHDYTGVSTITVSPNACGYRERWQVLYGRWNEAEACAENDGSELVRVVETHEFFGVEQEDAFRCEGVASLRPALFRRHHPFDSSCRNADSTATTSGQVLGRGRVVVDGRSYRAVQLVSRTRLGGATSGISIRKDWRRLSDGLLLRRTVVGDAHTGDGGGTHYRERYELHLLDPRPRR